MIVVEKNAVKRGFLPTPFSKSDLDINISRFLQSEQPFVDDCPANAQRLSQFLLRGITKTIFISKYTQCAKYLKIAQ